MNTDYENLWDGEYKIPWHDPAFSRRMLAEHLSQNHDMASRRTEWIDKQVAWIHDIQLGGTPSSVLDLGCGPGLYSHRLAARGHACTGIDIGPASIEYALMHTDHNWQCEFVLGDVTRAPFGGPHDLAMFLFGELNVFSHDEASSILARARSSLKPGGRLLVEMQTPEAVENTGHSDPTEQQLQSGLFSDRPHTYKTESRWLAGHRVALQTFTVTDAADGSERVYRNTTQQWSAADTARLITEAGFFRAEHAGTWPCNSESLWLWTASAE